MANRNQRHRREKSNIESKKALAGVKVLEYAEFVAAPYCTKLLADISASRIFSPIGFLQPAPCREAILA